MRLRPWIWPAVASAVALAAMVLGLLLVDRVGEDKVAVMPLFVAITAEMKLVFVGEQGGGDGGGEGGPRRVDPDTLRMFVANKAALNPGGGR